MRGIKEDLFGEIWKNTEKFKEIWRAIWEKMREN